MLTIRIEVPVERECVAEAELLAGRSRLASGAAVASASAALARRHGNPACSPLRAWGHPPAGSYELLDLGMKIGRAHV